MSEDIVRYFAGLPAADRRAIERALGAQGRAALKASLAQRQKPLAPSRAPIDLGAYSPWLRRHLRACLEEATARTQTPAAQAALRTVLERASPTP